MFSVTGRRPMATRIQSLSTSVRPLPSLAAIACRMPVFVRFREPGSTVEFLHDVAGARVLFATHYHELTALARRLAGVSNVTIDVREWHDEIVFLHKVKPGAADRSYGIQVAKLAGLPDRVVARAREVLAMLEKTEGKKDARNGALDELPLFALTRPPAAEPAGPSAVELAVDELNPDDLSPRAALDAVYRLKALRQEKRKPKR